MVNQMIECHYSDDGDARHFENELIAGRIPPRRKKRVACKRFECHLRFNRTLAQALGRTTWVLGRIQILAAVKFVTIERRDEETGNVRDM